ncbi:DNA-binding protein [Serratia marcescens]|uniref:DNA-binding protein n=1 Tax=Serratia marcescens TaxID=615 RepID=UPI00148E493E|nr:DNA-binding protein [Serratia marcescens]QJU38550.1 DNA-binding protein [Serratia marcescens]
MTVLIFKPSKDEQDKNVEEFIVFCKKLFNHQKRKYTWNDNVWDGLGTFIKLKTKHWDNGNSMNAEFIDFAKSYIVYQRGLSKKRNLKREMWVLKAIEASLIKLSGRACITDCNTIVFNLAVNILQKNYSESTAYGASIELEKFSAFLLEKKLVKDFFIGWVNPLRLKRVENYKPLSEVIGEKGKLSKLSAIEALACIFSKEDSELSEKDQYVSSVFALLMCAPSRISEILALPADCEIVEQDKDGVEHYGLRFYSGKGYGADIKWIPTVMVPVAQKAVSRLRRLSANARAIALWHEKNSTIFRLPTCPDVDEEQPLTNVQVYQALGYEINKKYNYSCKLKLKALFLNDKEKFLYRDYSYTLKTLFQSIRNSPPPDFPFFDREKEIKYSNALCVINGCQFSEDKQTNFWQIHKPSVDSVIMEVGPKNKGGPNIFEKHGFFDICGKPLTLHSHQARHLLNTFAHLGGLSDFDIARWSGRNNLTSNRDYNHISEEHMKSYTINISEQKQSTIEPTMGTDCEISFSDPDPGVHGAVLATEHGYCQHHYAIKPCSKFPGLDDTTGSGSVDLADFVDKLVCRTEQDKLDGVYGAEQWLELHLRYKQKLNKK